MKFVFNSLGGNRELDFRAGKQVEVLWQLAETVDDPAEKPMFHVVFDDGLEADVFGAELELVGFDQRPNKGTKAMRKRTIEVQVRGLDEFTMSLNVPDGVEDSGFITGFLIELLSSPFFTWNFCDGQSPVFDHQLEGRTLGVSLSALWTFYPGDDSAADSITTACGHRLEATRDSNGDVAYIDLRDPATGTILCCDGENCKVLKEDRETGAVTLLCEDDGILPFTLSPKEVDLAIFK